MFVISTENGLLDPMPETQISRGFHLKRLGKSDPSGTFNV